MNASKKRKKYPIGIQSFEKLRKEGYIYVDKTDLIYDLIDSGQCYFLSRPRRFGKSLLLSTIQAFFEGKKDLFEGLAISKLEEDWQEYPVIRLDLSAYDPMKENHIELILDTQLSRYEEKYGVVVPDTSYDQRFNRLIYGIYQKTGKNVVILIDEYDAPLTAHISDPLQFESKRNLLRSLYSNLKSMDEYLQFVMLSGITRFSKTTVFSGLNNLEDISLDDAYSTICGLSEDELHDYFSEGIENMALKTGISYDDVVGALKFNYDGYHFTSDCIDIYNPYSILQCLKKSRIAMYWYQSAKASLIVNLIKNTPQLLARELNSKADERMLSDIDIVSSSPTSLMFQAGYLTIKSWNPTMQTFTLGLPNYEVKKGLFADLAMAGLEVGESVLNASVWEAKSLLMKGKPLDAFNRIKAFLEGIPLLVTQNKPEIFYENNLFLILSLIGIDSSAESFTSEGRIDMILKFPEYIYVIELKLDGSAQDALNQIDSKNYSLPFRYDGRKVFKIGINFSSKTRNITEVLIDQ